MDSSFVEIGDGQIEYGRIEYVRIAGTAPQIVMLHEGLGSVAMWRDFPTALAAATGAEVVAYSRRGYGRSSPLKAPRAVDYMEGEAREGPAGTSQGAWHRGGRCCSAIATARRSP